MLNTMKLALVLALLMLSLGQTLSNLQPVAHQSEYTKDIIALPLKRGLERLDQSERIDILKLREKAEDLKIRSMRIISDVSDADSYSGSAHQFYYLKNDVKYIVGLARDMEKVVGAGHE